MEGVSKINKHVATFSVNVTTYHSRSGKTYLAEIKIGFMTFQERARTEDEAVKAVVEKFEKYLAEWN